MDAIITHQSKKTREFLTQEEESQLLCQYRKGSRVALHQLIEAHMPVIERVARQFSCNIDLDDTIQEAWLAAHDLVSSFNGQGRIGGYLKKFLPRRLSGFARQSAYPVRLTSYAMQKFKAGLTPEIENLIYQENSEHLDYVGSDDSLYEPLERESSAQSLVAAISTLPETQQYVIELHYLKGVAIAQIASDLGISPQAVYKCRNQGLDRLACYPGLDELMPQTADFSALEVVPQPQVEKVWKPRKSFFNSWLTLTQEAALFLLSTFKPKKQTMKLKHPFAEFKRSSKLYQLSDREKKVNRVLKICSVGTAIASLAVHPLFVIPTMGLALVSTLRQVIKAHKSLSPMGRSMAMFSAVLCMVLYSSIPVHAIEFSFLLGATEDMLKTCFFSEIGNMILLATIIFTGFRAYVMFLLASEAFQWVEAKRNNQNGSEQIRTIGYGVGAFVMVGVFEPFAARACGGAAGTNA